MSEHSRVNNYNSGFVVVKPTTFSIRVYTLMQHITSKLKGLDDQHALNRAISRLKRQESGIRTAFLNAYVYTCGKVYFERMRRFLPRADDPCSSVSKINCSVLVVHNNWIYTIEAKIYRFREHLMWLYDGEDQYYSSKTRKYLTYINPAPAATNATLSSSQQRKRQVLALKTALTIGHLLNRAVILPKFYCGTKAFECPLNSLVYIRRFNAFFKNLYRESSFLQHPRVSDAVKQSISVYELVLHTTHSLVTHNVKTITSNNVMSLFQNAENRVINYDILDEIQVIFSNASIGITFNERMRKAIRLSDYRQQNVRAF